MSAPESVRIALPIVQRFEGYAKEIGGGSVMAYPDPAHGWKIPTIGWGCTGADIKEGTTWTREQAVERLEREMARALSGATRASPVLDSSAARAAAILDFAFNLGGGQYQASTLRRKVNAADWGAAAREIRKWVFAGGRKLPGLVLRREMEALLLERGTA